MTENTPEADDTENMQDTESRWSSLPDEVPDIPPECLHCSYYDLDEHHTHIECPRCGWTADIMGAEHPEIEL